ncbi:hypothetical protein B0A50_08496 [Salinomyces thailandicus]|uniref:Uncharacterized protein n=1 Tax=Salinomyces thailandicus TaxID=706561 RepID=A0A4U0TJI3_9PEZI|nr:hypothetical protein B0A50_08496 [Salinomyces thailandica]
MAHGFRSNLKFYSIAGVGLFGDGFMNITIGLVVPIIGYLYYANEGDTVPTVPADAIKGAYAIGMIIGQLAFGLFGDALGRHKVAKLVLTIFANLGLGSFAAAIVYLILLAAFKGSIHDDINHLQWVWRLLFGIGLVPLILTLYARLTMKESKPYEEYVSTNTGLVATLHFMWVNLNQSIILKKIGYGTGATPYETLWNIAVGNIIVSCAGYLPGYYVAIFLPDRIGRVWQQFGGSALVAILYAIWAGVTNHTSTGGLMTLFTLSQFFLNLGPNATTFLIPVEVFPTRVRGSAHGIAAASVEFWDYPQALWRFLLESLLIPETKGKTIDEIEHGILYGEAASGLYDSASSGEVMATSTNMKHNTAEEIKAKDRV